MTNGLQRESRTRMYEIQVIKLLIAVLALVQISANFLIYLKQKSDLNKAVFSIKNDLRELEDKLVRGYGQVKEDLDCGAKALGLANKAANDDVRLLVKQATDGLGGLLGRQAGKPKP